MRRDILWHVLGRIEDIKEFREFKDAWKGCGEQQELLTKGSGRGRMAGTYRTLAYPGNERRAVCIGWGGVVRLRQDRK